MKVINKIISVAFILVSLIILIGIIFASYIEYTYKPEVAIKSTTVGIITVCLIALVIALYRKFSTGHNPIKQFFYKQDVKVVTTIIFFLQLYILSPQIAITSWTRLGRRS